MLIANIFTFTRIELCTVIYNMVITVYDLYSEHIGLSSMLMILIRLRISNIRKS